MQAELTIADGGRQIERRDELLTGQIFLSGPSQNNRQELPDPQTVERVLFQRKKVNRASCLARSSTSNRRVFG